MKITKSKIELYKIREIKMGGWADISIDALEKTGRLSISSSHGNWAFYWGSCGKTFKEFLCQLDIGYMAGKFGCSNYFDLDGTIKAWKVSVIESRREYDISQHEARILFDEIKDIEDEEPNLTAVKYMILSTGKLFYFFDSHPHIETIIDPDFQWFWENIWEPFTVELKKQFHEQVL